VFAVAGLIYWYSRSVTTWAANALDSALRNGPAAEYDPHLLGLSAFVIWCIHPLTWLLASFFIEGLVRIVGAISIEQVLPIIFGSSRLVLRQIHLSRTGRRRSAPSQWERAIPVFVASREGCGKDHRPPGSARQTCRSRVWR